MRVSISIAVLLHQMCLSSAFITPNSFAIPTTTSSENTILYSSRLSTTTLQNAANDNDSSITSTTTSTRPTPNQPPFSLPTALFLAGLAFDAYVEPPPTSSRWERGSSGVNVAFLSPAYTRSLYKGIIECTPIRASDLPDEDDTAESLMTGGGVDASLLVSVVEGAWKEDITKLEKEIRFSRMCTCRTIIHCME